MRSSLKQARERIAALRASLICSSPEAIEQCLAPLAEAAASLCCCQADPEALDEAVTLRRELARAARLIQSGTELNAGWARILGASTAGYTSKGDAAPVGAAGNVSIRG